MKTLVLGGTVFLGPHIVSAALAAGIMREGERQVIADWNARAD